VLTTQHPLSAKVGTTSPTSGVRSVGIVRLRTKATEFFFVYLVSHVVFPSGFPNKNVGAFIISHAYYTTRPFHNPLLEHPKNISWKSINYRFPYYAVFFSLLLPPLKIFSLAPCSQTHAIYVLSVKLETNFHTYEKQLDI
jgi:hypothetical protein